VRGCDSGSRTMDDDDGGTDDEATKQLRRSIDRWHCCSSSSSSSLHLSLDLYRYLISCCIIDLLISH